MTAPNETVDVLVVGAGPTGLTLAGQLTSFGVSVKVVDGKAGPVAESRALALQPRSLEVLRGSVTSRLVERGNRGVQLNWHAGGRTATLPLFDLGMTDTAYPFLLFLSQAETEEALVDHLAQQHVQVSWRTRLVEYASADEGTDRALHCSLVDAGGQRHVVRARYLVGCDGAHSTVRQQAGIGFSGGSYPQTFLLADADADGLEPGTVHVWFGSAGPLFFFPLRRPAAWRLLTARPGSGDDGADSVVDAGPVAFSELEQVVGESTGGTVRLDAPVWSTAFALHHRHADRYREGSVFVAGDAAHIHSPAGAQGMNTGIQDAVNLGWKLALVSRGISPERLLDTYDRERRPVAAFVLRLTDRAFTAATSTAPLVAGARVRLAPRALALAARWPRLRTLAFRTVSQLGVRYPDTLGESGRASSRAVPRPRPGERLPDVLLAGGERPRWFLDTVQDPAFHLLLCGPDSAWDQQVLSAMLRSHEDLLRTRLVDARTAAHWGVRDTAHLLVRPDGHVAYRQEDSDLSGIEAWLGRWLSG